MRIGVFGGAFDPVHTGHLILAEQGREQAQLDQVWFVPAARHPFKAESTAAAFERRVEMLQLAIAGHSAFRVNEIEKSRPGLSYTADTLDALTSQHPNDEFFLLVGGDALPDLPKWHDPQRVVRAATLVVMQRLGFPLPPVDEVRAAIGLPASERLRLQEIEAPLLDLSSRDIRRRVSQGRSIRYMVPRAVEVYIGEKGLYRSGDVRAE